MKLIKTHMIIIAVIIVIVVAYFVFFRKPKVVRVAKKQLGQTEIAGGSVEKGFANTSFQTKMNANGWAYGYDLCAIFVKSTVLDSLPKNKRDIVSKILTPSTQTNYANLQKASKSYNWIKAYNKPKVGAIVTFRSTSDASKGHTGIVTDVKGDVFYTIEGNVATVSGKDGVDTRRHTLKELNKTTGNKLLPLFFTIK